MFKKILAGIVLGYFCLHVVLISLAFWNISQIRSSRDLKDISSRLDTLFGIVAIEKKIGLGLWSLPYLSDSMSLVDSTLELLSESLVAAELVSDNVASAVTGQQTEEIKMDLLFNQAATVSTKLNGLQQILLSEKITKLATFLKLAERQDWYVSQIAATKATIEQAIRLKPDIKELLGYSGKKHVVILTQNNMELWPTGGYLGSYVEFYFNNGAVEQLNFQDIGVPNGQVTGYIPAPNPIATYTHNGQTPGWKLRESNWNPDFPAAMPVIEWFFIEGKVAPIDYMVAINLIPVVDLLKAIGPVYLADYNITLDSENFYLETQKQTSYGFFDGSTQKRDYLTSLGKHLISKVSDQPATLFLEGFKVVKNGLTTKQILIASKSESMADFLRQQGWDGGLTPVGCKDETKPCVADFLHINETNVGINKTNCCVDRQLTDEITVTDKTIQHHLVITYKNNNPAKPTPPDNWGGGYKVYQRLFVPSGSRVLGIQANGDKVDPYTIDRENYLDKHVIGFLGLIEGGQTGVYSIDYEVPVTSVGPYQLNLVKQSGIREIPWTITLNQNGESKHIDLMLTKDTWVE